MIKVIDLVKDDDVRPLAAREDITKAHALWAVGPEVVAIDFFHPDRVEATVTEQNGRKYRTKLGLENEKLTWTCSCGAGSFCVHLITTALDAQRESHRDIYKAAGIILKDRKMLVERSVGKPAFIGPGGRIQDDETVIEALIRELAEEFQIEVKAADLEPFGTFSAKAANHPGQQVHMTVFVVKRWQREIRPSSEVEEIRWLSSRLPKDIEVGSIFAHDILPKLKRLDLVD